MILAPEKHAPGNTISEGETLSNGTETIRMWTMVLAIVYTVLALVFVAAGGGGVLVVSLALVAVLLWAGFGLTKSGSYGPARICLIVAGILGLPLGVVAIIAGINIKKAGDEMSSGPTW